MSDADECGRCNGDGDIGEGSRVQTCPVCHGSGLSSAGEGRLWKAEIYELGYSLEHLRILAGPVCGHCYDNGELTPATERDAGQDWCANCHANASEGAWDRFCEDYYGGSGPLTMTQQADIDARDGRRMK